MRKERLSLSLGGFWMALVPSGGGVAILRQARLYAMLLTNLEPKATDVFKNTKSLAKSQRGAASQVVSGHKQNEANPSSSSLTIFGLRSFCDGPMLAPLNQYEYHSGLSVQASESQLICTSRTVWT